MKALLTGITGQDGYYLTKLLIENGYEVHGLIRRSSTFNTDRIDSLISEFIPKQKLFLYYSDLLDSSSLNNIINTVMPDEIYNLAAQSHVAVSFKNPLYTTQTSTVGPMTILEAVKTVIKKLSIIKPLCSEMFGENDFNSQMNQINLFQKALMPQVNFLHMKYKNYDELYNLFAVKWNTFNHESPLEVNICYATVQPELLGRNSSMEFKIN